MFRIKYSREIVLKLLYLADMVGAKDADANDLLDDNQNFFKSINDKEREFITRILDKIKQEREKIDKAIEENLIGWKLGRLMPIDRCLLRMGIAESYFNDQKAVIIDDIIRISKKYGSEDSFKIINAILDKVIQA